MNTLSWIVSVLVIIIIAALILNHKFKFLDKYKEKANYDKTYKAIHEKYKKLL